MNDSSSTVSLEVTGTNGDLFPTISDVPWQDGMNVQRAMEAAHDLSSDPMGSIHFYLEYFGPVDQGLGYMVTQWGDIDENDPWYWFYYVNGATATTGIDSCTLQAGDSVQWKYEQWSDDAHAHVPVLRAKRDRVMARTSGA